MDRLARLIVRRRRLVLAFTVVFVLFALWMPPGSRHFIAAAPVSDLTALVA